MREKKSIDLLNDLREKVNEIAKNGKLTPEELLMFNEVMGKADVEIDNLLTQNKQLIENNENLKNSNYSLLMRIASNDNTAAENQTSSNPDEVFNQITSKFLNN